MGEYGRETKNRFLLGMVDKPYNGDLPLIDINRELPNQNFTDRWPVLSILVEKLVESGRLV